MTKEAWRAAVTRWGDPIFGLALLLTDQRAIAETTTIAAFRRVFAAPPPADPETALYSALARSSRPQRWRLRRWPRRSVLPRELSRCAPHDRLLLGLWLLRNLDGAQLAATLGVPGTQIVARLAALLRQADPSLAELPTPDQPAAEHADSTRHVTLERWLEHQLGLTTAQTEHVRVCPACRAAQSQWQTARDQLRGALVAATRGQRLSQASLDTLEDVLTGDAEAEPQVWWQRRRVWLPALLGVIGLLLAALILPGNGRPGEATAASPTARALVEETLAVWGAPPAEGTLHQRVQSINMLLRDAEPVVTDLWLDATSPAHRVEVRRGEELVEWQIAEGLARFTYGGMPALNSCRWNTGYSGHFERFDDAALTFRISPAEQQMVRDARLRQGAYGSGYIMLQQALRAPDLRSFGTRVEDGTALTVLSFSDTTASPPQQVLLRLDPQRKQLHAVQQVTDAGGQTQARDLWRLLAQDSPESGISTTPPPWKPTKQLDRLVDPACPALKPEYVVSLRQLTGIPYGTQVLAKLPPGTTSAAVFGAQPQLNTQFSSLYDTSRTLDTLYVGPGRWLSLSRVEQREPAADADMVQRGDWTIEIDHTEPGSIWHGYIRPVKPYQAYYMPTIELWGYGWQRDELMAIVDLFQPLDVNLWSALEPTFVDARPLPADAHDALREAIQAVQLQPEQMAYTATEITARVGQQPSQPVPGDPFFLDQAQREPAQLRREQWFVAGKRGQARLRDVWSLPDGTVYLGQTSDGERIGIYVLESGVLWNASRETVPFRFQQPDLQMLQSLLGSNGAMTSAQQGNSVLIEQTIAQLTRDDLTLLNASFFIFQEPQMSDLPLGQGVIRLWLDRSTMLPQRLDLIHRGPQGQETPIVSTVVTERQVLEQPLPTSELTSLPMLPDDTLTMQVEPDRAPIISDNWRDRSWLGRSFAWPSGVGLSIVTDQPPNDTQQPPGEFGFSRNTWHTFEAQPFWRQTRYTLDGNSRGVTLTQGPRKYIGHALRYSAFASSYNGVWTSSERIPVTLAGEQRDAWLLKDASYAVLVVEADDLLLHFAGDEQDLRGFVVEHMRDLRPGLPERAEP